MTNFIDRRLNAKNKSAVNRRRFLRRYNQQIKKAVSDAINNRSVTDLDSGESISIPKRDVSEPTFHQGQGGYRDRVHPGNDQFAQGDKIKRPSSEQGGGSGEGEASPDGEGEDNFVFQISKEEYLDILFEDLELPNLKKNQIAQVTQFKTVRAGFKSNGNPSSIDIVRSLKNSLSRRTALAGKYKKQLKQAESQLTEQQKDPILNKADIQILEAEIEALKKQISKVPFIDEFDLRYKNYDKLPLPTSKAVMFCLMDVSGSMDQATKDMAKRFYILLYLFLTRTYKNVEVVYIRHHTQAKEVDEQEFFYSQETGGTIVSSALKLMADIVKDRYPESEWNIYAAQASDGDNWADDSPLCVDILNKHILPLIRYYAYIEITTRNHQSLWHEYEKLSTVHSHFALQHITQVSDIYPVFRELFKKQIK
ncbi:YeaH/YhbH family protein [Catenovulum sp. 2E275]|uniref:YeaH/YhbH family protein n=1 Tax=Catenovulum sp. 2E275 TaxID=2980497 RepID=UPI0021D1999F|nr:YeaH/YhbH family protein [Catenovulum sp. 2E275]MCU4676417.1 YeaH/YhbH family protein [Catenovulum sp. 2E275]